MTADVEPTGPEPHHCEHSCHPAEPSSGVRPFFMQAFANALGVAIAGTPVFIWLWATNSLTEEQAGSVAVAAIILVAGLFFAGLVKWAPVAVARIRDLNSGRSKDSGEMVVSLPVLIVVVSCIASIGWIIVTLVR